MFWLWDYIAKFPKIRIRVLVIYIYMIPQIITELYHVTKSLQSCPTLCDPIDGSPPGFPVPGILQARTLERGAIALFIWLYLESYTTVTGVRPWMKTTEVSPEPRSPLELTEPHCNHCQKSFWFLEASSLTPYCTKIPTQVGEESMATHSSILVWRILMDRVAWWATVHRVT